jgi:hypothetical protein
MVWRINAHLERHTHGVSRVRNLQCLGRLTGGTVRVALMMFVASGCGGPKTAAKPTNAEAIAAFQAQFQEQAAQILARPAAAAGHLDVFLESLAGYAEAYGEPFTDWLDEAAAVRARWGERPAKKIVEADLEKLRQVFAGP